MIDPKEIQGAGEECFFFQGEESGVLESWVVSKMLRDIESCKVEFQKITVEIQESTAKGVWEGGGIEQSRVEWLMAHPMELTKPILILKRNDKIGSHKILDGNHRYIALLIISEKLSLSKPAVPAFMISEEEAEKYKLSGVSALNKKQMALFLATPRQDLPA